MSMDTLGRTRADAEAHCRNMQAALSEAGRPDLAEWLNVEQDEYGAWYVVRFAMGFSEQDERLIHKAHRVVNGTPYCFACWQTQDEAVMFACDHEEMT